MTFGVVADAAAKREWNEAVDWYEAQEPGVGRRFDDALKTFLQSLSHAPERFPLLTPLARKAQMPRPWPYAVYFTINRVHREVKDLAVWHGARNPTALRRRIP